MKNIQKKSCFILIFTLIFAMLNGVSSLALSNDIVHPDSEINQINLSIDEKENIHVNSEEKFNSSEVSPMDGPTFEYYWSITSKTLYRTKFGEWRVGPTGFGPGSLSINDSQTINRNFTASISGQYPMGIGTIGSSLGVIIGRSSSYGTSYTITLASGERKTIIFRPKVNVYRVVQTRYRLNTVTNERVVMETQTAYVDVFNNWDYSWRHGY